MFFWLAYRKPTTRSDAPLVLFKPTQRGIARDAAMPAQMCVTTYLNQSHPSCLLSIQSSILIGHRSLRGESMAMPTAGRLSARQRWTWTRPGGAQRGGDRAHAGRRRVGRAPPPPRFPRPAVAFSESHLNLTRPCAASYAYSTYITTVLSQRFIWGPLLT